DLVTASNDIVDSSSSLNDLSEIRHLADGKMHIAGYYPDALRVINNPDENYTFSSQTVFSNPAYALTYYMPMQKVIKSLPPDGPQENVFTRTLKEKVYELTDQLGNVRAGVSDEKHVTLTAGVPGDFEPDVIAGNNYYPFGMLMPGRSFRSDEYRYGFNGMEKDDEVKDPGNSYDFGARMYDPRIGRWLSIDPLAFKFPSLSTYNFAGNSPIYNVDPDGKEIVPWWKSRSFLGFSWTSYETSMGWNDVSGGEFSRAFTRVYNFNRVFISV